MYRNLEKRFIVYDWEGKENGEGEESENYHILSRFRYFLNLKEYIHLTLCDKYIHEKKH